MQRAGGRGLELLRTPDDPSWRAPSPATCQAPSLGPRSLHANGATWRPPGRLRLSGPCLCTCSAPCVDPGSSLPPLSPDPLQGRLRQSWPQPPPVCRNGFLNVPVPESNPHPSSLLPWAQWVFPASMKTPLGAPSCPPHSRAASPSLGPYPEGSHQSPGPDALPPLPPSPPPGGWSLPLPVHSRPPDIVLPSRNQAWAKR